MERTLAERKDGSACLLRECCMSNELRTITDVLSPHSTAIANTLCVAWATNSYLGANTSAQSSSNGKL